MPYLGKLAGIVTVLIGGSVAVAGGFLLDLGVAWTAFVVLGCVLAVYAEGSYRLWSTTGEERDAAKQQLGKACSRESLIARLESYIRELTLLQAEAPDKRAIGPPYNWDEYIADYNHLAISIARDIRLHAPGFLEYWQSVPPGVDPAAHPPKDVGLPLFTQHSLDSLAHIAAQLRAGMDRP